MNDLEKFIIHYTQNSSQIMWLLGAGASRSAGIPTAWDIVWELKCRTYCLLQGKQFENYSDYTSPAIRDEVQSYIESLEEFKSVRPEEEYCFFLEYVYKDNPSGLREFIEEKVRNSGVHPSYGHKFLGILLKQKLCNIIWTTNFDSLIEDAFAQVGGKPSDLNVAELSSSVLAKQALNDGSKAFPLYVKLHGDFRFETIRNLKEDLHKNVEFSEALEIACNQYGMAVSGYSGRDDSVMQYLDSALDKQNPFPKGLFWFVRPNEKPLKAVLDLISKAQEKGVNAQILKIDSFNELMSTIKKQFSSLPSKLVHEHLDRKLMTPRVPIPEPSSKYPIIKTNAVPVISMPQKCYVLRNSEIKDFVSLRVRTKEMDDYFPVSFRNGEILSFDPKIKNIAAGDVGIFSVSPEMFEDKSETHLFNLLQKTIMGKMIEGKPLRLFSKGSTASVVVDYEQKDDRSLLPLSQAAQKVNHRKFLCGRIQNTQMHWAECVNINLERKFSEFWLVLKPDIWIYRGDRERDGFAQEWEEAKSFKDGQLKWRRNFSTAMLINSWQQLLFGEVGKDKQYSISIVDNEALSESFSVINNLAFSGRM